MKTLKKPNTIYILRAGMILCLLVLTDCYRTVNDTFYISSFKDIHGADTRISFREIKLSPETSLIKQKLNRLDFDYGLCSLNREFRIFHKYPGTNTRTIFCNDSIFILDNKFCLEVLLNINTTRDCIVPYIHKAYTFGLGGQKYLLMVLTEESGSGVNLLAWNMLFNITDTTNIKHISLQGHNSFPQGGGANFYDCYPDYFGDFNKDGKPDILIPDNFRFEAYTIQGDSLIKKENKSMKYSMEGDRFDGFKIQILKDSSSWFYTLPPRNTRKNFDFTLPDYKKTLYIHEH